MGQIDTADVNRAKGDIRGIETALNLYRLDNFRYPSTTEGLEALVTNPGEASAPNWRQQLPRIPRRSVGAALSVRDPGPARRFRRVLATARIARKAVKVSMPTSGTGIYEVAQRAALRRSAGFTLLELLVVVAIIGLLAGAVTLSWARSATTERSSEETNRLRSMIDLLHEEALMQTRDYGVMFSETGYRFYVFDYQQLKWVLPPVDRLLEQHALRPQLSMALVLDGRNVPLVRDFESQDVENPEPQVMLLSSGEVTPFTIEMQRDGHRTAVSS